MKVVRVDEKDEFEDMPMGREGMEVRRRKRSSQLGDVWWSHGLVERCHRQHLSSSYILASQQSASSPSGHWMKPHPLARLNHFGDPRIPPINSDSLFRPPQCK